MIGPYFLTVRKSVTIGVRIVRIRAESDLLPVRESIVIRVRIFIRRERVSTGVDFLGIGQAVAVAVLVSHKRDDGDAGRPDACAVGHPFGGDRELLRLVGLGHGVAYGIRRACRSPDEAVINIELHARDTLPGIRNSRQREGPALDKGLAVPGTGYGKSACLERAGHISRCRIARGVLYPGLECHGEISVETELG